VFGAVYTFRAYQVSMNGAATTHPFKDLTWNETLAFFLIALMIVFFGVYPQAIINFVGPSLENLKSLIQASNNLVP
jgi:NADH:ubiquinone oxidoreductase subunit 4 (subunit M)